MEHLFIEGTLYHKDAVKGMSVIIKEWDGTFNLVNIVSVEGDVIAIDYPDKRQTMDVMAFQEIAVRRK